MDSRVFETSVDSLKGNVNKFKLSLNNFKSAAEDIRSAMQSVRDSVLGIKSQTVGLQIYELEDLMNLTGEMFYDAESNIQDIEVVKDILLEDSEMILDIVDEIESLGEVL